MSDVRTDITTAHEDFIAGLGTAGTWWNSAERVAIAESVRSAREFADSAPWVTPEVLGVDVDSIELPDAALNTIWRLTNHPGTLTKDGYDATIEGLPWERHEAELRYVELVGLVAVLNAVDRLSDALARDRLPLPSPDGSTPSRKTVPVSVDVHWVPTATTHGPNVFRSLSAVPDAFTEVLAISDSHYVPQSAVAGDLSWDRGTLSRAQIELVAAVTSMHNECFY